MKSLLISQYKLVRSSRTALLSYCATIKNADLIKVVHDFGNGGSIRSLLVHINDTYHGWLARFALGQDFPAADASRYPDLDAIKQYFDQTDEWMAKFLGHFEQDYFFPLQHVPARPQVVTNPFEIFTHVITHEFHHKGQILTISRTQGYAPPDTDIIR